MGCPIPEISQTSQLNLTTSSVGRVTVGTTITYFCNEGYELTGGDNTATCTSTGEWSSPIPRCTEKSKLYLNCSRLNYHQRCC